MSILICEMGIFIYLLCWLLRLTNTHQKDFETNETKAQNKKGKVEQRVPDDRLPAGFKGGK